MKDYYYLLGLKQTATLDDIKNSYRRLSKKFHPDVNDGDAFFAERFKEIQEAYEVLSNAERRKVYDLKSANKYQQSSSNFSPEIEFFTSDKSGLHIGDDITFKWKTINADVVVLEPLGPVNPIGNITYKIKSVKVNKISFKLVAVNSNIDRKAEKEIIVNNLTYDEIYKEAYDNFRRENQSKHNDPKYGNKSTSNKENHDELDLKYDSWGEVKAMVVFLVSIGVFIFILKMFY